ncbi:hypothetical protein ABOM_007399 [Aspergillus bombycis]|uniref:HNH nuclease domain-containing protein n=1 Tax=Aspergillus bombycis TaxID=109264 RepID=A0A1F7ZZ38_9EURO|nr:hypothetical protein ABOM_007399 [Aspergillus bombycis]OGM44733.1 hypothetical protein ABOM_007399 [Aspergillus bombycis]
MDGNKSPKPVIPAKHEGEDIEKLHLVERVLNEDLRVAKKRLKAGGSFNATFWMQSAQVEDIILKRAQEERKTSFEMFKGTEEQWENTEEAKRLFEEIRSREVARRLARKRQEDLEETSKGRTLRASFMKLFTTSKMGLGIAGTGAGKRDAAVQKQFREDMIEKYGAQNPEQDFIWCPILGQHVSHATAAHLFAWMHGQDTMDAIFGKTSEPELFSPRNGLLIVSALEKYFDDGKLVIVPDLPERPHAAEVLRWLKGEAREYKIKIIDMTWEKLDRQVVVESPLTYRDLDGRRLKFRTPFRPAARYLYFHYCFQVLRRAWQLNGDKTADVYLRGESGRPFWGTLGRYLPKNMLLALVEELGHDYKDLLNGASCVKGEDDLLLGIASNQIKSKAAKRRALRNAGLADEIDFTDTESESESEDEEVC